MPPYAICTSPECRFEFDMKDEDDDISPRFPPFYCPTCRSRVIFSCPVYHCPISVLPHGQCPRCDVCSGFLRDGSAFRKTFIVGRDALVAESRSPGEENKAVRSPDAILGGTAGPRARTADPNRANPISSTGSKTTSTTRCRAV